jgi:ABC-type nitrate/sulfonate/bicarbonate transport system substrate-binding protein
MRHPVEHLLRRGKALTTVAAAVSLALMLSACGGGSGAGGGSSSAGGRDSVTVGMQTGTVTVYTARLAQQLGYFDKLNLDVKFVAGNSTAAGLSGLQGGSANFYLGGPETLTANQKGAGLQIVGATSNTSDFNIVAAPQFKTVKSLAGQNFAVSSVTSISTVAAKDAFVAQGMSQDAMKPVVIGATSSRYAALKAGTVAATTLGEPLLTQARADGFSILGYTDVDLGAPTMLTGTITSKTSWLQSNRNVAVRFLEGYLQAAKALYDPAMRDRVAPLVAKGLNVDPAEARKSLDATYVSEYDRSQPRDGHVDMDALLHSAQALQGVGALPPGADLDALVKSSVDESYIKEAAQHVGNT